MSREQSRQDKTQLKEEVDELRGLLDARDGEIKVDDFFSISILKMLNCFGFCEILFGHGCWPGVGEETRDPGQEPEEADGGGDQAQVGMMSLGCPTRFITTQSTK